MPMLKTRRKTRSSHRGSRTAILLCCLVFSALAHAQAIINEWDRAGAMAAVESVDIDAAVYEIGDISSLGDATTTLNNLAALETRSDWPLPAREAAIFQFTQSLADLPRDVVATEVMQHLRSYQAQTLVPHEDHGTSLVPLFNIRGAAAGVENSWQRTGFATEAFSVLEKDPTALVATYRESTSQIQRYGTLDALQQAAISDVWAVQNTALEQIGDQPELTAMLGLTAVITADTFAIQQLLTHGRGAGLSSTLLQLVNQLSRPDRAALLIFAIQQAPATNATLAISAWWPGLSHDADIRDLMVATLVDPQLGASAALALAQNPDIQTIRVLQDMASGDSIAAQRAQMALDLNRDDLVTGVQP